MLAEMAETNAVPNLLPDFRWSAPLYAVRVRDLGADDYVVIKCGACGHTAELWPGLLIGGPVATEPKVRFSQKHQGNCWPEIDVWVDAQPIRKMQPCVVRCSTAH